VVAPGLVDPKRCEILRHRAWRLSASGEASDIRAVVIRFEQDSPPTVPPEKRISKLYRLHRSEPAFRDIFASSSLTEVLLSLIGPNVDLFLSQVVFKLPGALGQPWHQDTAIFPFNPAGPVIGVWCALTPATEPSSRLAVASGSHCSIGLAHGRDVTHRTGGRYLALVDQAVANGELLELEVGDAVIFDARLVHATTDNHSDSPRIAAIAHFASAGTIDRTGEVFGADPFNDWMAWLRGGRPVAV
jgi:ectoine hydroxylase-related dioxygenase (phytanoyl-CoA dioxygenase family)